MSEPMNVMVEVWPVAVDETGLWLLSGEDAWRDGPVAADGDVHYMVESLLWQHGIGRWGNVMLHSTSWRPDGPHVVLTYIAAVRLDGLAMEKVPDAAPITPELAEAVGKPPTHAPTEPPVPRYIDVLFHALRHIKYLYDHDVTNAAAMGPLWRRHLEPFAPALAGLYSERHVA